MADSVRDPEIAAYSDHDDGYGGDEMAQYGFGFGSGAGDGLDGGDGNTSKSKKSATTPDDEEEKKTNADKHLGKVTESRQFSKAQRQLAVLGFDLTANEEDGEGADEAATAGGASTAGGGNSPGRQSSKGGAGGLSPQHSMGASGAHG